MVYMQHSSRVCVVPTLCNMWRHMEAAYGWDPAMYAALKSITLRLAQLVDFNSIYPLHCLRIDISFITIMLYVLKRYPVALVD